MRCEQNISGRNAMIAPPGAAVKGRIIAAGLSLGAVARAAGMGNPTLTGYLQGRARNIHGQIRIVRAFRRLTGQRIGAAKFWGDLWAENDFGIKAEGERRKAEVTRIA